MVCISAWVNFYIPVLSLYLFFPNFFFDRNNSEFVMLLGKLFARSHKMLPPDGLLGWIEWVQKK